jgi:hypothetical protein
MPHIFIKGCDATKIIRSINVHISVDFSPEFYKGGKGWKSKMDEMEEKISSIISEYFPDYSVEQISNHEYNLKKYKQ